MQATKRSRRLAGVQPDAGMPIAANSLFLQQLPEEVQDRILQTLVRCGREGVIRSTVPTPLSFSTDQQHCQPTVSVSV